MKIHILTMSAGSGHNIVSNNLKMQFEKLGNQVLVTNIYESKKRLLNLNNKGLIFIIKHFPNTYSMIWHKLKKQNPENRYKNEIQKWIKPIYGDVKNKIIKFNADVIVCTHYYASTIVCNIKRENLLNKKTKIYAILTDLLPHPFWESSILCDKIFTPSLDCFDELIKKGFVASQILPFGYPVSLKFGEPFDVIKYKKRLNLSDKFTILLVNGSVPSTAYLKIIKSLSKNNNVQMISVSGNNKKAFEKIEKYINKHNVENTINIGYCSEMEKVMRVSDIIITKCGCTTLFEAINSNLPIATVTKTYINEHENQQILKEKNILLQFKNHREFVKWVNVADNKQVILKSMRKAMQQYKNPNAIADICNYVINNKKPT